MRTFSPMTLQPSFPLSSRIILVLVYSFGNCSFFTQISLLKTLLSSFSLPLLSRLIQFSRFSEVFSFIHLCMLVGSNGFEPSTSRLSGARSSLLSYEPISGGVLPSGGDEEVRTLDLLRARQALSQLSYTPVLLKSLLLKRPFKTEQHSSLVP